MSLLSIITGAPQRESVSPKIQNDKAEVWAIVNQVLLYTAWGVTAYLTYKAIYMLIDEFAEGGDTKELKKMLAKRLNRPEIEEMKFDKYEQRLIVDVIGPDEIDVTFESIGGMDQELEEVKDNIVLPFQIAKHYKNCEGIAACPTGVLLYGAPGTGKSLTAKAIAREAGATFISIKASSVMDKWFGESDRLVSALFRLGRKLAPSVIFIDEIETLLKKRNAGEQNSGLHSMQGTFLSEWDGLASSSVVDVPATSPGKVHESAAPKTKGKEQSVAPVIVLGATNRPMDLDKAFLRRMPVQIQTKVPTLEGRVAILKAQLSREQLDEDVDLLSLAVRTERFTGSDIRELVRVASLQRMKSYINTARQGLKYATEVSKKTGVQIKTDMPLPTRPLSSSDFEYALHKTVTAADSTKEYGEAVENNEYLEKYQKQLAAIQKVAVAHKGDV